MIPAKPAKMDVLDKGDLLIVRKLLKIGGGQEIPAYRLIRYYLSFLSLNAASRRFRSPRTIPCIVAFSDSK